MKKLALLMFAILILGCGTEKPVVEEPVVEELEPIIEEPPPVVMEDEHLMPADTTPPQIIGGNLLDGDVDADPELLNRDGIALQFTEPLNMYTASIGGGGKWTLDWSPHHVVNHRDIGNQVHLMPMADSLLLEHNTEYKVSVYVQDFACNGVWTAIEFRTKPR